MIWLTSELSVLQHLRSRIADGYGLTHISQFETEIHSHRLTDRQNQARLYNLAETGPRRGDLIAPGLQKLELVDALLVAGGLPAGALLQIA